MDLPIIKGLDDYIPQEDFFDEELLKRIKKADGEAKTNNKEEPKASRNLPQRVKDKKLLKAQNPSMEDKKKLLNPQNVSKE